MNYRTILPILDWFPNYKKSWLKGDISAGLTVGVMLIPQGMAYASIAGLPAVYGLYASIIPILVYALLGTSRQLAVGPVAMVSLLTATAIGSFEGLSTSEYISYAILLAFMVGTIQFILGVSRLGFLVNFLSHPVISGFTSAAALIIGMSQLKHLVGLDIPRSHHIYEILANVVEKFTEINWTAFGIGLIGIIIIIGSKKINRSIPGQLLAVIFGIVVVSVFGLSDGTNTVNIVRDIPSSLPSFSISSFDLGIMQLLIPMALTISLISFIQYSASQLHRHRQSGFVR